MVSSLDKKQLMHFEFSADKSKLKMISQIEVVDYETGVISVVSLLTLMFERNASSMGCQVGKKHLLFTYMAIMFSHIGTI